MGKIQILQIILIILPGVCNGLKELQIYRESDRDFDKILRSLNFESPNISSNLKKYSEKDANYQTCEILPILSKFISSSGIFALLLLPFLTIFPLTILLGLKWLHLLLWKFLIKKKKAKNLLFKPIFILEQMMMTTPEPTFPFTVVYGFENNPKRWDLTIRRGECQNLTDEITDVNEHRHSVNTHGKCFTIYLLEDCEGDRRNMDPISSDQLIGEPYHDKFRSFRLCI